MQNQHSSIRTKKIAVLVLTALLAKLSFSQNLDISYMSSGGKLKPLQAIMDIRHYTINMDVDIANKSIQGNTIVTLNLSKQTDTILLDLVHLLTVEKIKVDNKSAKFEQGDDKIYITI